MRAPFGTGPGRLSADIAVSRCVMRSNGACVSFVSLCAPSCLRVLRASFLAAKVNRTLDAIASDCLTRGLALTRAKYIAEDEMHLPDPSIRVVRASLLCCGCMFSLLPQPRRELTVVVGPVALFPWCIYFCVRRASRQGTPRRNSLMR